jgi:threonine/homoserine/homoserine lactone efflux protein
MLFDTRTLFAFVVAASALVIAPGPGQALVVTRTVQGGQRAGWLTALGLQIGTIVHTFAAAFGLSAILATSSTAFSLVKYAGAAYLIGLGLRSLHRARSNTIATTADVPSAAGSRLVLHAALTGVLNPKVAVFFFAFLPQFVRPERGAVLAQFIALGLLLASIGLTWDTCVVAITGRARARLLTNPRFAVWRERLTGTVLIGLGLRLAYTERQ